MQELQFRCRCKSLQNGETRRLQRKKLHRSSDQDIETRLSRESKNFNFEEDVNHFRTGRPVVCSQRASQTRSSRDCMSIDLDEEQITVERGD